MVGQERLESKFNSYTLSSLPKSILLEGEEGCGKHSLVNIVSENTGMPIVDISDNLTLDTLDRICVSAVHTIYLIDCNFITEREQNVILKSLEEPVSTSYFILLVENKDVLLDTIVNRCVCYTFEKYDIDTLKQFSNDELILSVATTPGQVLKYSNLNVGNVVDFITNIFNKISKASLANILVLPLKIKFKEKDEGIDFNLLVKLLPIVTNNLIRQNPDSLLFTQYNLITNKFVSKLNKYKGLVKQREFETYLMDLKGVRV